LPKLFDDNYYNVIEVFQGERNIDVVMHARDLFVEKDGVQQNEKQ
jgi:hypothetical protein